MNPTSDVLTLFSIVCKSMEKIYKEFLLDLGYCFSTPPLVMDLILKIINEKIGRIANMNQHLSEGRSTRRRYIFHGVHILETTRLENAW